VCGSEDFSSIEKPFDNIDHQVKVYVTSKYPNGSTFGGIQVTVVDYICFTTFGLENRFTCHSKRFVMRKCLFVMIFGMC
jgi:hypothetical protein